MVIMQEISVEKCKGDDIKEIPKHCIVFVTNSLREMVISTDNI